MDSQVQVPTSSSTSFTRNIRAKSHTDIQVLHAGDEDSHDYRVHAVKDEAIVDKPVSFWHDLPLFAVDELGQPTGTLHFVCEIPKCTRKKFEVSTGEAGNPIKQDVKKGILREFKKGDIFFNYGCFPRTWEDPDFIHPDAGVGGDNDPLDVCEIGMRIIPTGTVRRVKILGVLCMIDDGEADWKVIAIDEEDRWAPELNDVEDVENLVPGTIDAIREWFRTYKSALSWDYEFQPYSAYALPDGKPENRFGLGGRCMGHEYAMHIIEETHDAWKRLVCGLKDEVIVEVELETSGEVESKSKGSIAGAGRGSHRNLSYPSLTELDPNTIVQDEMALNHVATRLSGTDDLVPKAQEDDYDLGLDLDF